MLTMYDAKYVTEEIMPKLEANLADAQEAVKQAASHRDLRENAEYDAACQKRDSLLAERNLYRSLLDGPRYIPQSKNIVIGNKVRITPVDPTQYKETTMRYNGDSYQVQSVVIPNLFVISEHINEPSKGFINKEAQIINQVYGKPSGQYSLKIGSLTRTYEYEVIIE